MVNDYATIEHDIDRSRILMGVVIPRNYSQELGAGREAQVQLLLDGSDSNTASIALGYAESLVRSYSLELRDAGAEPPRRRASGAAGGRAAARLVQQLAGIARTTWCRG